MPSIWRKAWRAFRLKQSARGGLASAILFAADQGVAAVQSA